MLLGYQMDLDGPFTDVCHVYVKLRTRTLDCWRPTIARILRRAGQVNEVCRFPLLARMLASESVDSVPLTAQTDSVRAREEQCEQNDGSTSVYRASQRGHKVMEEGPSIALPW